MSSSVIARFSLGIPNVMVSHSAAAQTSSCLIRNGLRGWPVWIVCKRRSVKGEVLSFTATKTTHYFWCSKLPIDICISSSIKRLCVQVFFSWRQHWNGSISSTGRWFWSRKLSTSVLSLHTHGAWTEREGCTNWYRGSTTPCRLRGDRWQKWKCCFLSRCLGKMARIRTRWFQVAPQFFWWIFFVSFFVNESQIKHWTGKKTLWLFHLMCDETYFDFICHCAFLLFCSSKWWIFIFRIWRHHNFQVLLPGEFFIFQLTWSLQKLQDLMKLLRSG